MKKLKYFSTFSGIGGFELGIKQAYEELYNLRPNELEDSKGPDKLHDSKNKLKQWECVGYSEIDKYACQIYNKHFNHKNYGDITKIKAEELPEFDLLVGGFPCQAFSIAGKRQGFNDTRGTLFFDLARILKAKRPRLFVFENVKGLLSHDGGGTFATIIATLDELGYDCQWQVLNSKNFGVPQNRERVFIVGHLRGTPRPKVFPIGEADKEINRDRGIPKVIARGGLQNHSGEMIEQSPALTEAMGKGGGQTPVIKNIDNIITCNRCGSEVEKETESDYPYYCAECDENMFGIEVTIKQLNKPKHSNDRVYSDGGLSPTLNTMQGGNRQPFISKETKIRRLTPMECERLQGFPDDWTECGNSQTPCKNGDKCLNGFLEKEHYHEVDISDTQRYKTLGNAVTVNVVKEVVKRLIKQL